MHIVCRNYKDGDAWKLAQIDLQGYEEPMTEEQVMIVRNQIKVITVDGEAVGWYAVEPKASIAKMMRFNIAPSHRRRGLGSRLLKDLYEEYGLFKKVTTLISESNEPAYNLLRKHHWKCRSVVKNAFTECGYPTDGYFFVRILSSSKPRTSP